MTIGKLPLVNKCPQPRILQVWKMQLVTEQGVSFNQLLQLNKPALADFVSPVFPYYNKAKGRNHSMSNSQTAKSHDNNGIRSMHTNISNCTPYICNCRISLLPIRITQIRETNFQKQKLLVSISLIDWVLMLYSIPLLSDTRYRYRNCALLVVPHLPFFAQTLCNVTCVFWL